MEDAGGGGTGAGTFWISRGGEGGGHEAGGAVGGGGAGTF